jgi:lactose/L-arabinose transport system substrate-binding protein
MFNGRVYAIPWDLAPCAVFYKLDLFAKYGIDPSSIRTWDEYIHAGELILKASDGETRMLFHPTATAEILFEILLRQAGGQVFDGSGRIAVNSAASIQVLDLLRRFSYSGIGANTQYWTPAFFASFKSDAVASYPMAVWFGRFIQDYAPGDSGRWGVFKLPAIDTTTRYATTYGGSTLVIPKQSQNKEAAWAFVEFMLCNRTVQLAHYQHFDLFPAMSAVYSDPFFDEPVAYFGGQPIRRLFANEVDAIPAFNRTPDWEETRLYLRQALSRWLSGNTSSQSFLDEFEQKLAMRLGREIAPASRSRNGARHEN